VVQVSRVMIRSLKDSRAWTATARTDPPNMITPAKGLVEDRTVNHRNSGGLAFYSFALIRSFICAIHGLIVTSRFTSSHDNMSWSEENWLNRLSVKVIAL
jgi:hypothetical protein